VGYVSSARSSKSCAREKLECTPVNTCLGSSPASFIARS
ncbi:hypothetical protein D046_4953B, partial [Vibrio parahaemolyticus V-223/04]